MEQKKKRPIKGGVGREDNTESAFSEKILTKADSITGKSFRIEPMKVSKEAMISEGELKQLGISWGSRKIHKANSYRKQDNLLLEKS